MRTVEGREPMSLWLRVLSRVAPDWHWRMTCPDTIESAARDFIDNRLPPRYDVHAIHFDNVDAREPWFAWRRRISGIYGIATWYSHPKRSEPKRGWNRRLWRRYPDFAPEQLVDKVLDAMMDLLGTAVRDPSDTVSERHHEAGKTNQDDGRTIGNQPRGERGGAGAD